jgi:outer membrane cobalamin receptor
MARLAGRPLLLLIIVACGTTSVAQRGPSSDVLTRAEIESSRAANAYELLQQLRPQFLRSRGAFSVNDPRGGFPVVYINDMPHGDLNALRSILIEEIDEIRYISAADATTRWGTGHAGGVIQVRANY